MNKTRNTDKRKNFKDRNSNSMRGKQGRADSKTKRINADNERVSKFDKQYEKDSRKCEANDVRWYASNAMLLQSAASLPFSTSVGLPVSQSATRGVPGVMAMSWVPFINGGDRAPIQQAANAIYSYTVHANSRNKDYDPADEMLVILAGAQAFQAIAVGVRAYGTMQQFNQQDYYTPQALIQAMGFKYEDLRANLSKMWFDLNELIARMQQVWIPNVMPVLERWFWLNSNIYLDANSAKAQYYLFVPHYFLYYSERTAETGGSLTPYPWGIGSNHTWAEYLAAVNKCIDALLNSQDRGMIFGDILKAYGADRLYAMQPIPVDYRVVPQFNTEVLTQIENLTVFRSGISGVYQDENGNLYSKGVVQQLPASSWKLDLGHSILNFHQIAQPSPDQIMVATRLKTSGLIVQEAFTGEGGGYYIVPALAGTEYIDEVDTYCYAWTSGVKSLVKKAVWPSQTGALNLDMLYNWCAFDWAPWLYSTGSDPYGSITVGATYSTEFIAAYGDWDNYTLVSPEVLRKMHTTAVYSEFGVPTNLT